MTLFDIHTHNPSNQSCDTYNCKSVLSTTPLSADINILRYREDHFSCGIHPWYSENWKYQLSILEDILANPFCIAIGECGLDKVIGLDIKTQIEIFENQILLSERLCKPMIIHCVRSWDTLLSLHKQIEPSQPWIVHGFRKKPSLAKQLLDAGMYLSFGEIYNLQTAKDVPIDRIFCETDQSSLSIYEVYDNVANTLCMSIEDLAMQIDGNMHRVFTSL